MKARNGVLAVSNLFSGLVLGFVLCLCGLPSDVAAQRSQAPLGGAAALADACAGAGPVSVHASRSAAAGLSLCDGRAVASSAFSSGQGEPLALASGDFDEDGTPDLVTGFAEGKSGSIIVHRGNVQALWPYGAALRNGPPPAFLPNPHRSSVPQSPDFLVTGDFNADGHLDVVTAQRGSDALYFLRGNGHGGFLAAERFPVQGKITALISGEINRADGLADLIVAVDSAAGSRVLIYESPAGALKAQPEIFKLAEPVTALALGRFDGGAMNGLAIASGNSLAVIHPRDRKLSLSEEQRATVPPAKFTIQHLSFTINALTAGDFTGAGPSVAALDPDGKIHILEHQIIESIFGSKAAEDPNFLPSIQVARLGREGKPILLSGHMAPSTLSRLEAIRTALKASKSSEWTERSSVTLPAGFSSQLPRLVTGRVSGSLQDDILIPDSGNRQLHIVSTGPRPRMANPASAVREASAPATMKLLTSLNAETEPVAVLPMRLNQHGLNGLVILQHGQSAPTVMPQTAANVFTVTNTSDQVITAGTTYTGPAGSLRKALYDAGQATGTSSIVFNIPTTDPGYNSKTGTFLIQPLSESVPGAFNDFALNPINNTVTIDGYTQPGASPNTLANGDNAKILIQIDGAKATTPGGAGLVPFDDVGSTYRGLDFTGWTLGQITNNTESGAEGIEANGLADFIEGNFFGADPTGKIAAGNRIGIFADNGPGFGNPTAGNIIGGTTPQARNLLSGNTLAGVLFLSTAIEATLKGSFVGLDSTGAAVLPNGADGAGLNGQTVTIGGALPGDGNVISGNPTNVDINDITEGGAAMNSTVQGNLVGTDVTGAKSPSGGKDIGVSIVAGPQHMLIGGTTPAARNIVSGNNYGVYVFDGAFYNTVQGNYIGTDVTGSKALGNVSDGFATGVDSDPDVMLDDQISAGDTTLGGSVAGAGNLISGNALNGVAVEGASLGPESTDQTLQGNIIQGNLIGTDATGTKPIPNLANGIAITGGAANNIIGGTAPGAGNLISNNAINGILIDPGTPSNGNGVNNSTVGNTIWSNGKAGVEINTGANSPISRNSIYLNTGLGIALGTGGPNINTNCNATNTGPNNSQNAPVLTAGTGNAFITATATDPNGNTSQFSNAVKESLSGDVLSLMGAFNSLPSTTYTIEFFSSPTEGSGGYGQGDTYLGSTTVTTDATCKATVNDPVNTIEADMSVTLTTNGDTVIGPDYGENVYTATVTNLGAATAHNVVFTDTLPAGLSFSNMYCDVGPCQTTVVSSLGMCTVTGQVATCNLGTMAPGATASLSIPVQASTSGSLVSTAKVTATETDPNPANNTATSTATTVYPIPFADTVSPASVLVKSGSFPLIVYGESFVHQTAISFNGTPLPTTAVYDNQQCTDSGQQVICTGIQVEVPASLITTAGTVTVEASNPDPTFEGEPNFPTDINFTIAPSCTYSIDGDPGPTVTAFFSPIENDGTSLIPEFADVGASVQTCPWTPKSTVPWAVVLASYNNDANDANLNSVGPGGTVYGDGEMSIAIAPNTTGSSRSGSITLGNLTLSFTQDGGATCGFALTPTSSSFTSTGGSGSVAIKTGDASDCSEFVVPEASWITVPQASGLLAGSATANYSVAANVGPPRVGTVLIGGAALIVNQAAPACYYTLSTTAASLPVAGGTGSIGVTPSSSSCKWTATSSNPALLSITSGASGAGNGTVNYSVPLNTGGPESPTITIGDATGYTVFTETQASSYTCTFAISPTPVSVPADGASNFFLVNASFGVCKWTAASSDPTALAINGASSGTGTAAVYYSVAQNTTGKPRVLTITAGCETFIVNQAGGSSVSNNPTPAITQLQPSSATAGSGAFTLTVTGSGFIATSSVNFNGSPRATQYVSGTQLTASILASDIATAGTPSVTVTNPSPGGGASNSLTFTVNGASAPGVSFSPASIAFGSQTVNTTSAAQSVTLTNNGTAALTISGISISGTNPSDFAQTNTCGTSLAAGAKCIISVSFKPASAASFSAAISVADNASGSPQTAALSGTGTAATAPGASLSATSLAFGDQTVNTTSAPQTLTLKNTGTAPLTGITISLSESAAPAVARRVRVAAGISSADYAATTTCGSTLAAGSSCAIAVTFTPTKTGSLPGILTVIDNASNAPQTAALSGAGSAATAPGASLSATSLAFGNQTVNTTSAAQTVTLTNFGTAALAISEITLTGANPADFTQTNTCGTSVAAGGHCTISVSFKPASAASFAASVSIADNATGSPQTVALTGTGTTAAVPGVSLNPSSLSFGNQPQNSTSAAQSVKLTNSGNAPLTINGLSLTGAGAGSFSLTNGCASASPLAAGASCSISVKFSPSAVQSYLAAVTIADNASTSPQTIPLTGVGVSSTPQATLLPSPLSFGNVAVGATSAAMQLTLKNTGAVAFPISSTSFTGSAETSFALSQTGATCAATLAVGASCNYAITFSPTASGAVSASFNVTDATDGVTVTAALSGTGALPSAALSPTSLSFGNQTVSTSSSPQTVTLTNSGNAPLTGIAIILTEGSTAPTVRRARSQAAGINSTDYSAATTCGTTLTAGASCSIAVTFTPHSAGSLPGTLSVQDNASNSPQTAALSGAGTVVMAPNVVFSPTSLSFGSQLAGTTSAIQAITLQNTGNAALAITSLTITGANSADFDKTSNCGSSVAAGSSCVISVVFTPASTGSFTASISVADNASGSPQTVGLTGTGTAAPTFTVSSTTAAQTILPGGSAQYSITVASQNGTFASPVTLSASGLPKGATASFSPASVTPGSSSASSQLTIQTLSTAAAASGLSAWAVAASALPLLSLFLGTRRFRKRWVTLGILFVASLAAAVGLTGCGGGFGLSGVPPTTYSVTVTGTSGAVQQTTTVQLTVK